MGFRGRGQWLKGGVNGRGLRPLHVPQERSPAIRDGYGLPGLTSGSQYIHGDVRGDGTQHNRGETGRYMDDTCVMKEEQVNDILEHLNKQHPTIKFTMEKENGSLPFLDTLLRR